MANSERNMYYKHNMSMYGNNASIVEELKYLWDNPSLTVNIYKKSIFLLKIGYFFAIFCDIIFT